MHMVQTGGSLQEGSQTILEPGHPYDFKTITIGSNHYFERCKQNFTRRAIVDEKVEGGPYVTRDGKKPSSLLAVAARCLTG